MQATLEGRVLPVAREEGLCLSLRHDEGCLAYQDDLTKHKARYLMKIDEDGDGKCTPRTEGRWGVSANLAEQTMVEWKQEKRGNRQLVS